MYILFFSDSDDKGVTITHHFTGVFSSLDELNKSIPLTNAFGQVYMLYEYTKETEDWFNCYMYVKMDMNTTMEDVEKSWK